MAILDRVKLRTQTDLTDGEIQSMIDEANQDIISKYGPHADPTNPITVMLDGYRHNLIMPRAIDVTASPAPVFIEYWYDFAGETPITLGVNDYRIWPPGYKVERTNFGNMPGSWPNFNWGRKVQVTYVPVNDGNQREEVMIKMVIIAIQYDAFKQQTVGDYSGQTSDYITERNNLLDSLAPRHGLLVL